MIRLGRGRIRPLLFAFLLTSILFCFLLALFWVQLQAARGDFSSLDRPTAVLKASPEPLLLVLPDARPLDHAGRASLFCAGGTVGQGSGRTGTRPKARTGILPQRGRGLSLKAAHRGFSVWSFSGAWTGSEPKSRTPGLFRRLYNPLSFCYDTVSYTHLTLPTICSV